MVFHPRHRWLGWVDGDPGRGWRFATPGGERVEGFDAVVLALGGGSWPRLGSDGAWCQLLGEANVPLTPLAPTNCGFELPWSEHLRERFAGTPLKHVALSLTDRHGRQWRRKGELVVSAYGIEGSLVYALSAPLRDLLADGAQATLWLDWLPDTGPREIVERLGQPRRGLSFANLLRKRLRLPPIASALLRECCPALDPGDAAAVAAALKATPLMPRAPRPIAEAISSAGGVRFDGVDGDLMLRALPGVFVAGEMLDWEAPTGGYLLSACFATGKRAGEGVSAWLAARR